MLDLTKVSSYDSFMIKSNLLTFTSSDSKKLKECKAETDNNQNDLSQVLLSSSVIATATHESSDNKSNLNSKTDEIKERSMIVSDHAIEPSGLVFSIPAKLFIFPYTFIDPSSLMCNDSDELSQFVEFANNNSNDYTAKSTDNQIRVSHTRVEQSKADIRSSSCDIFPLVVEVIEQMKKKQGSFWDAFIKVLPSKESTDIFIDSYPLHILDLFCDDLLREEALYLKQTIHNLYDIYCNQVEIAPHVNFDDFRYAYWMTRSRCHKIPNSVIAIVPFADMVNHSSKARDCGEFVYDENNDKQKTLKSYSFFASKKMMPGERVMGNYGANRTNSDLLLTYGFIPSDNILAERYIIDIPLDIVKAHQQIEHLWRQLGSPEAIELIKSPTFSFPFLRICRLMILSTRYSQGFYPFGHENEYPTHCVFSDELNFDGSKKAVEDGAIDIFETVLMNELSQLKNGWGQACEIENTTQITEGSNTKTISVAKSYLSMRMDILQHNLSLLYLTKQLQ